MGRRWAAALVHVRYVSRLRVLLKPKADRYLNTVSRADGAIERARKLQKLILASECLLLNLNNHSHIKRVRTEIRMTASMFRAMFTLVVDDSNETWIDITPELEQLHEDELEMRGLRDASNKPVETIRKLLMMSKHQAILISKLTKLKKELMLPDDFDTNLVHRYPKFFGVVPSQRGPVLQLGSWDMSLAETARERDQIFHPGTPESSFFLTEQEDAIQTEDYKKFQRLYFPSPYEPSPRTTRWDMVYEKRIVGVYHELLSLMPFKRCVHTVFSLLRSELELPVCTREMLLRHPGIFYAAEAVRPIRVFLREAFAGCKLKHQGPEDLIRDRYLELLIKSEDVDPRPLRLERDTDLPQSFRIETSESKSRRRRR